MNNYICDELLFTRYIEIINVFCLLKFEWDTLYFVDFLPKKNLKTKSKTYKYLKKFIQQKRIKINIKLYRV